MYSIKEFPNPDGTSFVRIVFDNDKRLFLHYADGKIRTEVRPYVSIQRFFHIPPQKEWDWRQKVLDLYIEKRLDIRWDKVLKINFLLTYPQRNPDVGYYISGDYTALPRRLTAFEKMAVVLYEASFLA